MKKAIIIGASSGIGKGLAKLLAENDYKVGITGRKTELLDELVLAPIMLAKFKEVNNSYPLPHQWS